jgi:protein-disulfide isomerase
VRGFSTLILGQHNREGNFVYAGFCGTGPSETLSPIVITPAADGNAGPSPGDAAAKGVDRMSGPGETPRLAVPVSARDHIQGLATAAVTLVEYGDYECPSCGAARDGPCTGWSAALASPRRAPTAAVPNVLTVPDNRERRAIVTPTPFRSR